MAFRNPVTVGEDRTDWRGEIAAWFGSKLLLVGIIAVLVGGGALVYYAQHFSNAYPDPKSVETAQNFIDTLRIVYLVGLVVFAAGMVVQFWGDVALPLTLFLVAALFIFSGDLLSLSGLLNEGRAEEMMQVSRTCIAALRLGGVVLGAIALLVQILDVAARVRSRAIYGAKEEAVKYGQGIKEESDYRNVFLGKCWQLPFCRKFVRERCPIYHARRACWRERVGCMCEEEVIRGAMEAKAIPKDVVAAAKFIPRNNRLTPGQKAERCRQCVIYNEHQRHKYRLMVWLVPCAFLVLYFLFHTPLIAATNKFMQGLDGAFAKFALTSPNREYAPVITDQAGMMEEVMLVLLVLFVLSQAMKVVEFAIFKLKI